MYRKSSIPEYLMSETWRRSYLPLPIFPEYTLFHCTHAERSMIR